MIKKVLEYCDNLWYSIFRIMKGKVISMESNNITVFDVANYFRSKESMTHKKLQKLVYYAYVQYIIEYNTADDISRFLFKDKPEAWLHGPVFASLYQEYKKYNWKEIPKKIIVRSRYNDDVIAILNKTWDKYGIYSADKLEYMTHCELPWQKARNELSHNAYSNNIITPESIYKFYISK